MRTVIVRYSEIALKSEPIRRKFEGLLIRNIHSMLGAMSHKLRKSRGRIFIDVTSPKRVARVLSQIPGVASCSPALRVEADLEQITSVARGLVERRLPLGGSFAVRTRRHGKHPFTSREVNERVGAEILRSVRGTRVDLSNPDCEVSIEIRKSEAYLFTVVVRGIGGLPVGSQGKGLAWFSGEGRDLEAAALMLKKGCEVQLMAPKAPEIFPKARRLLKHHPQVKIHALPLARLEKILSRFSAKLRFLCFRRSLVRLGNLLGERVGAQALIFSDGARLLALRGLEWLRLADEPSKLPVFRPLLGEDLACLKPWRLKRARLPAPEQIESAERLIPPELLQEIVARVETRVLGASR
jgi:thiamine biosynthesis protein ThiI